MSTSRRQLEQLQEGYHTPSMFLDCPDLAGMDHSCLDSPLLADMSALSAAEDGDTGATDVAVLSCPSNTVTDPVGHRPKKAVLRANATSRRLQQL